MNNKDYLEQLREIQAFTSQIKSLIAQSHAKEAIGQLLNHQNNDLDHNHLIHLSARWEQNENAYYISNIIALEDYRLERNKIVNALLAILDRLYRSAERENPQNKTTEDETTPFSSNTPTLPKQANKVFLMYDKLDAQYSQKLVKFLTTLKRNKKIDLFDMHKDVSLGQTKETVWLEHLKVSTLVLCAVTVNFLWGATYELAEQAQQLQLVVVPILINEVDLEGSPFEGLVPLPKDGRFVAQWDNEDAAYANIARTIRQYFEQMTSNN